MSELIGLQIMERGRVIYYPAPAFPLKQGALCVVETEHGLAMAKVVKPQVASGERRTAVSQRRVLRAATPRDLDQAKALARQELDAYHLCQRLILEKKLSMKLVDVTFTLDGRKAVFFFTAENRVDFRELVKDLAQALKLKIEMRQVGVRDEARRLGGVGCCGRSLCCCTFLKDFVSVSIRMAKDQNVSLNPTKVSGICGRLMCCLSYEYDGSAKRPGKDKKSAEAAACPGTCAGQPETAAAPAPGQPAAHRPGGRRIFGRQERPGGPTPGSAERGNRPPSFGQRRPEGNRPEGGRPQPSGDRHAKGPFPRRDERRRP